MASRDATSPPGFPWRPQMGPWDAILASVKDQIPSLDSDSSLSDFEDEELFIFQRDQTALIPDLSEELAEDPAYNGMSWFLEAAADKCPCEPALVPVEFAVEPGSDQKARTKDRALQEGSNVPGPSQNCGEMNCLPRTPEESPRWQEVLKDVSFSTKEPQSPPGGLQGETPTCTHAKWAPVTEASGMPSPPHQALASAGLRAVRRERRKMIERDVLRKVTWGTRGPTCEEHTQAKRTPPEAPGGAPRPQTPPGTPQAGQPVLSLQQLDKWDLDSILQSLGGLEEDGRDRGPGTTWRAADHCQGQDHTVPAAQDRLMERLACLCATQSRLPPSARKVPAEKLHNTEEQLASHRLASTRLHFQAKPGQGTRLMGMSEPPTVFIDLRPARPPGCPFLDSSSSSSSDSEEDAMTARDPQGLAKGELFSPQQLRDCTGKNHLLQQLRAFRRGTAVPELGAGESPSSQKAQAPEHADTAGSGTRRKQHVQVRAQGQGSPPTRPGGSPRALGDPLGPVTAREALISQLGQPQMPQAVGPEERGWET